MAHVHFFPDRLSWQRPVQQDAAMLRAQHSARHEKLAATEPADGSLLVCPRTIEPRVCPLGGGTIMTLYGPSISGQSVALHIAGFRPYFFVQFIDCAAVEPTTEMHIWAAGVTAWLNGVTTCMLFGPEAAGRRLGALEAAIASGRATAVVATEWTRALPIRSSGPGAGYNGPEDVAAKWFLRIDVYAPELVGRLRTIIEHSQHASAVIDCARRVADATRARNAARRAATATTNDDAVCSGGGKRKTPTSIAMEVAAKKSSSGLFAPKPRQLQANDNNDDDDDEEDDDDQLRKLLETVDFDNVVEEPRNGNEADGQRRFDVTEWQHVVGPVLAQTYTHRASGKLCAGQTYKKAVQDRCDAVYHHAANQQLSNPFIGAEAAKVYEADLPIDLRLCIDAGFRPEEWIRLPPAWQAWIVIGARRSTSDLEIACPDWRLVQPACADADASPTAARLRDTPPPQQCISFDGEMQPTATGGFPRPDADAVLQLCAVVFDPVRDPSCTGAVSRVFCLGELPPRGGPELANAAPGTVCFAFADELAMLQAFSAWLAAMQPDMLTGYNIETFDVWYVAERAKTLGAPGPLNWGRATAGNTGLRVVDRVFESTAAGKHEFREAQIRGAWVYDLLQALKRDAMVRLRKYTLESVADHFLGDKKEDVAYSAITTLQQTADGRAKLARYCIKDAVLPARIIGKQHAALEMIALCRGTGVTIDMLVRRGQQIRGKSNLYREALGPARPQTSGQPMRELFYTRTDRERADDEANATSYEGAVVIDPIRGLHTAPVIVLDFSSLYPSIIVSNNMCPTTLLPFNGAERVERMQRLGLDWQRDVWHPDPALRPDQDGICFVRQHVREGIVPRILRRLLGLRKAVKARLAAAKKRLETAPTAETKAEMAYLVSVLDKQQNAIKLICNSMYGLFGTHTSFVTCQPLAAGVTMEGRRVITRTKAFVETEVRRDRGWPCNATVVYGDTDSVFVRLDDLDAGMDIAAVAQLGVRLAAMVTAMLKAEAGNRADDIMKLEFEKIFAPLIILAKKRYAGPKWTLQSDGITVKTPTEVSSSGMETARRDPPRLVSEGIGHLLGVLLKAGNMSRDERLAAGREYVHRHMVAPLKAGTIDYWQIIQTKQLRKSVAAYLESAGGGEDAQLQVHVQLTERLRRRHGPESPMVPRPGDRVPYVMVERLEEGGKSTSCGEDPMYAWQHHLPLNLKHYLTNALRPPLIRLFGPLLVPDETRIQAPSAESRKRILEEYVDNWLFGETCTMPAAIEQPAAKRPKTGGGGPLSRLKRQARCTACAVPLDVADADRCTTCARRAPEHDMPATELHAERAKLWNTCFTCMGHDKIPQPPPDIEDLSRHISCVNKDCPTFFARLRNDRLMTGY